MAKFIPEIKPEDFNNSYGEMKVYEALRSLGNQYTIFYSLSWVGVSDRRTIGEADFVVAHPDKGIFVIEVKSGEIEYKKGEWIQTNTKNGKQKTITPYTQARKSQFELLERVELARPRVKIPMMCYGVWFPSIEVKEKDSLPPEAPKEITLDKTSLDRPEKAIEAAFDYWAKKYRQVKLSTAEFQKIEEILCPHFHIVPKLKTKMEETELSYIQLTSQQASVLDFLEEQKTAVVHGLAGTGKTVLALEKAKSLAAKDEQVLFLCYNSFLKESLKNNNAIPNVTFHNAHSLAYEIMGGSEKDIDKVLEEFEEFLSEVFEPEDWPYVNVIIDEGQDLSDTLINALYSLVKRKNGFFYVFYDRNQYILKNKMPKWIEDAECRLVLHKNCRNTAEVFKTSCSIMGLENVTYNEIHGEIPTAKFYSTESELNRIIEQFIQTVKAEGVLPEDIVILSAKTVEDSWVDVNRKYSGYELSTERTAGKVLFTTIRKFKGLESDVVLIVDASMAALRKSENKRLLYVGTSRAKNLLNIAMLEDVSTEDMGDYLRELNPERNVPKNKKGLKRLLNISI